MKSYSQNSGSDSPPSRKSGLSSNSGLPVNSIDRDDDLIRFCLKNRPLRKADTQSISQKMADEMTQSRNYDWTHNLFSFFKAQWKYEAACMVIIVCLIFYLGAFFIFPIDCPISKIQFVSSSTGAQQEIPWLWKRKLQGGNLVRIPNDAKATLHAIDGSIIECNPGTLIAVQFTGKRRIEIASGMIMINAATDSFNPMVVKTPISEIRVIGTVFWVKVVE
jgi:FecR-like protein